MACEEGMDEDQHAYEKDWGSDIKRDQFHETENIEDETDSNQYEEDQLFHHESVSFGSRFLLCICARMHSHSMEYDNIVKYHTNSCHGQLAHGILSV